MNPVVVALNEPSDAAWRRAADIAAIILENLAIRDALEESCANEVLTNRQPVGLSSNQRSS